MVYGCCVGGGGGGGGGDDYDTPVDSIIGNLFTSRLTSLYHRFGLLEQLTWLYLRFFRFYLIIVFLFVKHHHVPELAEEGTNILSALVP